MARGRRGVEVCGTSIRAGLRGSTGFLRLASVLWVLVLVSQGGYAQVQTGTPPFGSFSGGPFDTVNNANLDRISPSRF
jgi:hypothetical protein